MKRIQFSLSSLLIGTTFVALLTTGILWLTRDYRERQRAEGRLRSFGASYAHMDENHASSVVFGQPIVSAKIGSVKSIDKVELKFFAVDRVTLQNLCTLERIESLMFQSCTLTDMKDLAELSRLQKIKSLHFWHTPISDEALDAIARIRGLEELTFVGAGVTDQGLAKLRNTSPGIKVKPLP